MVKNYRYSFKVGTNSFEMMLREEKQVSRCLVVKGLEYKFYSCMECAELSIPLIFSGNWKIFPKLGMT